jgi:uncharacterized protein (TIGR03067 family)
MKLRFILLAACLFVAAGCGSFRDRSMLSAGTWVMDRMELAGDVQQNESFEIAFSPHGNSVTITVGDKVHKGVYELQGDKNPKEIDIKPDATNRSDKPLHGIYELDTDGRGLLLCLSSKKRPKQFATKTDTDCVLIKLHRQ